MPEGKKGSKKAAPSQPAPRTPPHTGAPRDNGGDALVVAGQRHVSHGHKRLPAGVMRKLLAAKAVACNSNRPVRVSATATRQGAHRLLHSGRECQWRGQRTGAVNVMNVGSQVVVRGNAFWCCLDACGLQVEALDMGHAGRKQGSRGGRAEKPATPAMADCVFAWT